MDFKSEYAGLPTSDYLSSGVCTELMKGKKAFARAKIKGAPGFPEVCGVSEFFRTSLGVLICAHVQNLPWNKCDLFAQEAYGLGISGGDISDSENKKLPDIFGNGGYAWCAVLAPKLKSDDIYGKAIFIGDDESEQPKKTKVRKIAFGIIQKI